MAEKPKGGRLPKCGPAADFRWRDMASTLCSSVSTGALYVLCAVFLAACANQPPLPPPPPSAFLTNALQKAQEGDFIDPIVDDEYANFFGSPETHKRWSSDKLTSRALELATSVINIARADYRAYSWRLGSAHCMSVIHADVPLSAALFVESEDGYATADAHLNALYAAMDSACPASHDLFGVYNPAYGSVVKDIYGKLHKAELPEVAAMLDRLKAETERRKRSKLEAEAEQQHNKAVAMCHEKNGYKRWEIAGEILGDENTIKFATAAMSREDEIENVSGVEDLTERHQAGAMLVGASNDLASARENYRRVGGNIKNVKSVRDNGDPCAMIN